jgi:hypothetical protein
VTQITESTVLMAQTHAIRSCERVTLTRIVVVEGRGVPDDPMREVTYFYDDDGHCVVRRDLVARGAGNQERPDQ